MKSFLLVTFLVFAFYSAEAQRAGTLDSSFGENGVSITNKPGFVRTFKVLSDDKILVGSGSKLARYLPDGSLDSSFGINGLSVINYPIYLSKGIAIQPDNKIILTGSFRLDGSLFRSLAVLRCLPNGMIDSSFGINGLFLDNSGLQQYPMDITIESDNKLILCGYYAYGEQYYVDNFLLKLNANGTADSSFGINGELIFNYPGYYYPQKIALQKDGKIVTAGNNGYFFLRRHFPNGQIDSSFGINGIVQTRFDKDEQELHDLIIETNDKIVCVGTTQVLGFPGSGSYMAFSRYNINGSLDNTFGEGGKSRVKFDYLSSATSLAIQKNGKYLAGGYTLNLTATIFAATRLLKNGNIDSTFGINGKSTTEVGTLNDLNFIGIGLQQDGRIIMSAEIQLNHSEFYDNTTLIAYYGDPIKQQSPIVEKIRRWIRNHTLNWQYLYTDVDHFVIEQSSNDVNGFKEIAKVKAIKSDTYSYSLKNLIPHNNKYYRITAINTDGSKVISDVISDEDIISIIISPNPAKNVLKISGLPVNQKATISIINRNGNVLQSATSYSSTYNMNVSTLRNGLYNVQVIINDKIQSLKFVKE